MTHSTEVHFGVPLLEDLYCINCKVEHTGSMLNSIVKSLFHVQILYCRLIIYSIRCCIASPSIQNIGDVVHVIVSKRFYATGKLQSHLSDLKIKYSDPEPVHSKIYEACLKYTITFKLAPLWNCIGKSWYLYGDNFLSLPYNNDAIEWEIYYKGEETKLGLKPMKVNLLPFSLDNVLPALILENFKKSSTQFMNLGFESPQVYVLPKLTKGKAVTVSKSLPKSCPFENYDILRRHWKNMYSYRLPKTAEGMLFYEVIFAVNPNQKFTYPEMCLLSSRPEFLASDNKNAVASKFLKDLSESLRSICNEPVKIGRLYPELPTERSRQSVRDINYPIFPYKDLNSVATYSMTPTDEYIVKPPEKKLKLSNMFTFKGIDKMTPHMRDHSQKVLSIMNGQNKKTKASSSSQYNSGTSSDNNEGKFANGSIRRLSLGNLSTSSKRRTEINNTNNVCSYYDIPTMYPTKNVSTTQTQNSTCDTSDTRSKEPTCQASNPFAFGFSAPSYPAAKSKLKPTIKSVETVSFDLNGIRKIRTINEVQKANIGFENTKNVKSKNVNDNEVTSPFFEQEKDDKHVSKINSMKKVQKENSFGDENCHKMDVETQFKKSENSRDILKENRGPGDKEDLRSLFSKFDSYNIGEEEDQQFENNVYSECNNIPFMFKEAEDAQENLSYQRFNNLSEEQNSISQISLSPIQTSPTLSHRHHSPKISPGHSRQSVHTPQFLETTTEVTVENRTNAHYPSPLGYQVNSRNKSQGQEEPQNKPLAGESDAKKSRQRENFFNSLKIGVSDLDESISSNYTYELCGDSLIKKYHESRKSPIFLSSQTVVKSQKEPGENNVSFEDDSRYSPSLLDANNKTTQRVTFNEAKDDQRSSSTYFTPDSRANFKFSANSPLSETRGKFDKFEIDRNSPTLFSEDDKEDDRVFNLDELGQNNAACDNSDFLSIITQSTDSEDEESVAYAHLKQEYVEALTYND